MRILTPSQFALWCEQERVDTMDSPGIRCLEEKICDGCQTLGGCTFKEGHTTPHVMFCDYTMSYYLWFTNEESDE
jgi:hypothetical protein